MRRVAFAAILLLGFVLPATTQPKPKKKPCAADLASCAAEGCGTLFDPNLNKLKNLVADEGQATRHTLAWMKKLDDPENFTEGDERDELADLGEGQKVTVIAYLLTAKPEGGESCNCGLDSPADSDNHLVLVTKATVDKFPLTKPITAAKKKAAFAKREPQSITAEFTPRVRLAHPNFTRDNIETLIKDTPQRALLVRVTGQLLFDSEHFLKKHLTRVNNWEIHPILRLEYCSTGKCKSTGDVGWKSLDDL
jgi:hypothetical protein